MTTPEAKKEGIPLTPTEPQVDYYAGGLLADIPHVTLPLPFVYESTGVESFFRDTHDPQPSIVTFGDSDEYRAGGHVRAARDGAAGSSADLGGRV